MRQDEGLKDALKIFGEAYIAELSIMLRKLDKKASGDLLKSLDTRLIKTAFGTIYTIQLVAEDYLEFVDGGRRPNRKPPPIQAIKKWTRFKGIPEGAAYPIAKSIGEKGIKPTNVISKSLQKLTRSKGFRELQEDAGDWLEDLVAQLMFDVSKNNNITVRVR